MSVSNGEKADESVFNSSFVSREIDDNKAAKLTLDDPDVVSGTAVTNTQRELNSQSSYTGAPLNQAKDQTPTWSSDAIGTANQPVKDRVDSVQSAVETNQTNIAGNTTDIADIRTTTGTVDSDTDMGTYTPGSNGFNVTDNSSTKQNVQDLIDEVDLKIDLTEKGAANGVATLDGAGRIPNSQLPTSALEYKGAYNASTNTPTLADGVGTTGDTYDVTVAGTQDLGSGSITFDAGDNVRYDGSVWIKLDANDSVTPTNAVALDNKTIDGDNNTITNLAHGAEVDNPTSGVHGVTGNVVGTTDTQVLTAKDIDGGTASNTNRITLPKNTTTNLDALTDKEATLAYDTDLQKPVYNDGTQWVAVGAGTGSGAGKKNYFTGGEFEDNIDLATRYDDPGYSNGGTGGAPTVITIASTGFSLAGANSLEISKGIADGSGEGVSLTSNTIDLIDIGKDFTFEFAYDFNDSNYTSGDVKVRAYDVTTSAELPVIAIANLDDNAGLLRALTKGYVKVLTNSTTQQVRVSFHLESDSDPASDWVGTVDECILSPSSVLIGNIITEWQREVIPINGSVSAPTKGTNVLVDHVNWRRVGDSMEIQYFYRQTDATGTAAGNGLYLFPIPDGKTIDVFKFEPGFSGTLNTVGSASVYAGAGSLNQTGSVVMHNSENLAICAGDNTQGDTIVSSTFLPITGGAVYYTFSATVPILEWTNSNALLSANEVAFKGFRSGAFDALPQTLPTSGSFQTLNLNQIWYDPFGAADLPNNKIVIPKSDWYVCFGIVTYAANATGNRGALINSSVLGNIANQLLPNAGSDATTVQTSTIEYLTAGTEVTLQGYQNSGGNLNLVGGAAQTGLKVISWHDLTTFGTYGETEFKELIGGSDVSTTTLNTYVDVPGLSFELDAGVWDIGYHSSIFAQRLSGTAVGVVGNTAIRDAANNVISGAVTMFYDIQSDANDWKVWPMSATTQVTISQKTTFKLSIRCNYNSTVDPNTAVITYISSSGFTGTLTDPDVSPNFWARKVK